jgi:hypothetical protein
MARTPSIEGDRARFVRTRRCEIVGKGLGVLGLGDLFCCYFKLFCCQVVRAGEAWDEPLGGGGAEWVEGGVGRRGCRGLTPRRGWAWGFVVGIVGG